jgi:hypothetical protein
MDNFLFTTNRQNNGHTNRRLPATLQAYDLQDDREIFLAEQVVNNQSEIATFTTRYAGKLIKAKAQVPADTYAGGYRPTITQRRKKSTAGIILLVVLLVLVALAIYGYTTGWLQQQLHLNRSNGVVVPASIVKL